MTTIATPVTQHSSSEAGLQPVCMDASPSRLADYYELGKPRIALMVLMSTAVGYLLACEGNWQTMPLVHASFGILLSVIASSALNQFVERETDGRMLRTKNRPLPAQRLSPTEVLMIGILCGIGGVSYLLWKVNALTAALTLLTIVLYAGVYTPMKRYTTFCTVVGAVPGALPPVLGWTAARGTLDAAGLSLFAIMFVWQFPHFVAIAWMYRDQYEQAGLKMIPGRGRPGIVGAISAAYALVLLPVSLLPIHFGLAGTLYGLCAMSLGLVYAIASIRFQREETRPRARQVLWASLGYLPCVLLALALDHIRLLS